ncbi:MAG: hypothetical protein ACSHXK_06830 [Oceanococcus sp.]
MPTTQAIDLLHIALSPLEKSSLHRHSIVLGASILVHCTKMDALQHLLTAQMAYRCRWHQFCF